jgi:hypothetical protein
MKVRVCFAGAPRVRTRLLARRYRVLGDLMIPESQHNDSMAREEFRPRAITNLACTIIMSTAVQFDTQLCAGTIEIQDVIVERMLPPKFVACEISVP